MSILRRTVYYDETGGFVRFRDWATVVTTLGEMAEPYNVNQRVGFNQDFADYDPEEMMARIDLIEHIDATQENRAYSGNSDSPPVNGGVHMPRVGR